MSGRSVIIVQVRPLNHKVGVGMQRCLVMYGSLDRVSCEHRELLIRDPHRWNKKKNALLGIQFFSCVLSGINHRVFVNYFLTRRISRLSCFTCAFRIRVSKSAALCFISWYAVCAAALADMATVSSFSFRATIPWGGRVVGTAWKFRNSGC